MPGKIILQLLIICAIWYQEITATTANEENRESSDNLVRQKRVINRIPGEDRTVMINRVPYMLKVKQNLRIQCAGSILSQHIAITAAQCVESETSQYHVLSGGARIECGTVHTVTDIKRRFGNHPNRPEDGIALLTVDPSFSYGPHSYRIELHSGSLVPGTLGTISGWGYNARTENPGTCHLRNLRSIEVPIMAHQDCVNSYRYSDIEISHVDICTYHPQKHCGHLDIGAPLAVNGYLVGVHLWSGPLKGAYHPEYPEVFAFLKDSVYSEWIRSNI